MNVIHASVYHGFLIIAGGSPSQRVQFKTRDRSVAIGTLCTEVCARFAAGELIVDELAIGVLAIGESTVLSSISQPSPVLRAGSD